MTLSTEQPQIPNSFQPNLENLKLKDVLRTLPRACFEKNQVKAWSQVIINVVMVGLGYLAIAYSPWYLLPLAWFFTGTALTGFFVIGHDCGHRSFAKRRWVNDLVGHIFMAPLIYPFHSWRLLHDVHHTHTNKLEIDNAWQPFMPEFYDSMGPVGKIGYQGMRGWFWWLASIIHWANIHFDWNQFQGRQRSQVRLSVFVVLGFAAIAFPTLLLTGGVWGFVKFWLLPWLVYHFWMSTFTLVHHTLPNIPFRAASEWNAVEAQLAGTVHCEYPWLVEFLCHHINVHIPHHLSVAIPSYNLRMAHNSLKQNWQPYMIEREFNLALVREIVDECHLYHPETNYQSCKAYEASKRK